MSIGLKMLMLLAFITQSETKIGDILVKFTSLQCMKEEESTFVSNISCKMKPINRTATQFSGLCYEPKERNYMLVSENCL